MVDIFDKLLIIHKLLLKIFIIILISNVIFLFLIVGHLIEYNILLPIIILFVLAINHEILLYVLHIILAKNLKTVEVFDDLEIARKYSYFFNEENINNNFDSSKNIIITHSFIILKSQNIINNDIIRINDEWVFFRWYYHWHTILSSNEIIKMIEEIIYI